MPAQRFEEPGPVTNAQDIWASVVTGLFFGAFSGPGWRWIWMWRNVPPKHAQAANPADATPAAVLDGEKGDQSRGDD